MIWSNRELKVEDLEVMNGDCYGIRIGNEGVFFCTINAMQIRFPVKEGQILDGNSVSATQGGTIINKDVGLSLLISTRSEYDEKLARGSIEILYGKNSLEMISRGCGRNDRQNHSGDYSDCWIEYLLSVNGNVAIAVRKSGIVDDHEAWYVILVHDFIAKDAKNGNVLHHFDKLHSRIPKGDLIQTFKVEYMKKDDVVEYFNNIDEPLPKWINEDGSFAEGYPKTLSFNS